MAETLSSLSDLKAPGTEGCCHSATQACGDGDANIEPGEIWNVPVRLSNTGEDAMNDGLAVFSGGSAPGTSSGGSGGISDGFGYRALASASSSSCRYQPVDMSAAGSLVPTQGPHGSFPANDEGFVAGLAVGGAAPFRFYNSDLSTLMMSTNGYLSTNVADGGDDYRPVCGIDNFQGVVDGRIQALHRDLAIQSGGSMKHRHFDSCPRAADAGAASQGCTVFEWRGMGNVASGGGVSGNAVFQTILYDQSFEIVHQYISADPDSGATAVIGQQSPDEVHRLNYKCSVSNAAPTGTSVCFFHPSALPARVQNLPTIEPIWFEWLALGGMLLFGSWLLGMRGVWALLLSSDPTGITLVIIVVFIQKRPQGIFAVKGRNAEA